MRKIILAAGMSLDGYIARLSGAVDFLVMPKDYSMAAFLKSVDTAVMGRKTLDVARSLGGLFADSMATYVFSRTQAPGKRDGVTFVNQSPAALIGRLRRQRGKHIWLMGGGELVHEFLQADLIDELSLGLVPIMLGEGIPLFPCGFPQRKFRLASNQSYSQGLVELKYRRAKK